MISSLPLTFQILLFAAAAAVVALAGVRMATVADQLADRTGLGEAVVGGILLGASTSLSGTVTSITAASQGMASLAASNAIGGIAAQTAFLVVADMSYRRINLEHAGPDVRHLLQTVLLILMLALPLAAVFLPEFTLAQIHPVSILLVAVYFAGMIATMRMDRQPTWVPQRSAETREDVPEPEDEKAPATARLAVEFTLLALVLAVAGYVIAETGGTLTQVAGISETLVGTLLTSTATSLPELVTTLAAVRRGALQLAIGGIVGGNTFDVLFLSLSDVAYREGSLYHALLPRDLLVIVAGIIITAILLMGLILRDRRAIGFEGVAILTIYAALAAILVGMG